MWASITFLRRFRHNGFFDHRGCPLNSREKDHSLFIANSENNPQKEEVIIQSLIQRR
jgi:hypothetical protein